MATWINPRSGHEHLIDYVIVRQRDLKEVLVTKVMRGAECSTDHSLVRLKVRLRLARFCRSKTEGKMRKLDICRLKNPDVAARFQYTLATRLADPATPVSSEEQWRII